MKLYLLTLATLFSTNQSYAESIYTNFNYNSKTVKLTGTSLFNAAKSVGIVKEPTIELLSGNIIENEEVQSIDYNIKKLKQLNLHNGDFYLRNEIRNPEKYDLPFPLKEFKLPHNFKAPGPGGIGGGGRQINFP